jgi:hypothetical protein
MGPHAHPVPTFGGENLLQFACGELPSCPEDSRCPAGRPRLRLLSGVGWAGVPIPLLPSAVRACRSSRKRTRKLSKGQPRSRILSWV